MYQQIRLIWLNTVKGLGMAEFYRKKIGGRMEMDRFRWIYFGVDLRNIQSFICFNIPRYNGFYFRTEPGIPKIARR